MHLLDFNLLLLIEIDRKIDQTYGGNPFVKLIDK